MNRRTRKKLDNKAGKSTAPKAKQKQGELTEKQLEAIAGGLARKRSRK